MTAGKLQKQLEILAKRDRHRLHMPGHKGRGLPLAALDFTEIPGSDNLHDPRGIIADVQNDLAGLYGSVSAQLVVGGTTAGNMAALMAGAAPGEAVLVPVNSHRSVFSALALGRIEGRFITPVLDGTLGFPRELTVEQVEAALDRFPEVRGMILTTPTYYGTVSDTAALAECLHRRDKWLIVDEAHGAHLAFCPDYPRDAVASGADVVIQSSHKMLATYTQASLLHCCSRRIDPQRIARFLTMLESSSPSYLLMMAVENGVREAAQRGHTPFEGIAKRWDQTQKRQRAGTKLRLYAPPAAQPYDKSKWLWAVADGSGLAIAKKWRESFGVYCEIETAGYLLALTGMGTRTEDLDALDNAVAACQEPVPEPEACPVDPVPAAARFNQTVPLWQAFYEQRRQQCPLAACAGRIAARSVIPYPPGVPVLLPGDTITREMAGYLAGCLRRGETVIGADKDAGLEVLAV